MSFSFRGETKDLDDTTRREASGSFLLLSDGITHYELSNPDLEETVVLIHGFSTPYFIYDPTFAFLTQAGLRVLRYDLFGRGLSDRPQTAYSIDLFIRQLAELLERLGVAGSVSLVGLSMGGPIAAAFIAHYPEQVNRLVLIDPAGAKAAFPRLALRVFRLPGFGEMLFNLIGNEAMVRNIASDVFEPRYVEHFQSRYLVQMQYKGFKQAILSTIRSGMLESFLEGYKGIGKMDKPVLLFWGRQDRTVPFRYSTDLKKAIPQAQLHVIEHCGHIPHYEKPGEVQPILLEFLRH